MRSLVCVPRERPSRRPSREKSNQKIRSPAKPVNYFGAPPASGFADLNPNRSFSLRKPDPPQQILEARVVVQVIPFRFDLQKNHFWIALLKATLQPAKRFVTLSQAVVD